MRKLKLQMGVSVDGFVSRPESESWISEWDEQLWRFTADLIETSDTILLGRGMTPEFMTYWEEAANKPEDQEFRIAKLLVDMPKIVFSQTINEVAGLNSRVENGPLVEAVTQLKQQPGKDLIVYGGIGFVSSLIENGLIDEFHFFVHPFAFGGGGRIFKSLVPLKHEASTAYECGIVVNSYILDNNQT
ncbi:dihydrofolate reductase family protein [Phyllobacterium sp. YR531]|uniref:dihydrofolate reductase family protein n=1 Tax=Phyllobacterium sp. YR531 TaxID=1144343 RepID=UPI00026F48FA|nr:dihydrofolate reductase family protein [Phyllobacterium sp. YR531]EJN06494.1 dihydrofolate reductase [Phyllobacterium sp. YR531]